MDEGKRKRQIVALTVGAVLLLAILVSVWVFQLVAVSVQRAKYAELQEQIALYEELKGDSEKRLEQRLRYDWIVRRARELGYVFTDDVK